MQTVLRTLSGLALVALTAFLGEAAWTVHFLRPKIAVTVSNLDRTIIVAGAAANHLEKAAGTWEAASKAQAEQSTAVLSSSRETFASLQKLVKHTDALLNGSVLPSLAIAVTDQDQSLLETQKQLRESLSQMQAATVEAQKALADADVQISNPAIKESVDSLAVTAQNTADLTEHAAATMKSVRSGVEYEVAEIEKPVKKAKAALLFVVKAIGIFFGY